MWDTGDKMVAYFVPIDLFERNLRLQTFHKSQQVIVNDEPMKFPIAKDQKSNVVAKKARKEKKYREQCRR
jgi:hypothetical protein